MAHWVFRLCDLSGVADWLRCGRPRPPGVGIPVDAGDVARTGVDPTSEEL